MVAVEVYYLHGNGYLQTWDAHCVDHPEINCTVSNGAPGHNYQTKEENYAEMQEAIVARYNLVMGTSLAPEEFTYTEVAPPPPHRQQDADVEVIDFKDME